MEYLIHLLYADIFFGLENVCLSWIRELYATRRMHGDWNRSLMHTRMMQDVAGTFNYIAPEVILQGQASCKADIFSYGVVLWCIRLALPSPPVVHPCSSAASWCTNRAALDIQTFLWSLLHKLLCINQKNYVNPPHMPGLITFTSKSRIEMFPFVSIQPLRFEGMMYS